MTGDDQLRQIEVDILVTVRDAERPAFREVYRALLFGDADRHYRHHTIVDHWKRLVADGYLEETAPGTYEVTQSGAEWIP